MPRYFFHLIDDGQVWVDDQGVQLKELSMAHEYALKLQREDPGILSREPIQIDDKSRGRCRTDTANHTSQTPYQWMRLLLVGCSESLTAPLKILL
jgi:hypothetical protein